MAELYGPFIILDELIQLMINGEDLPLDRLHICGSRSCSKSFSVEHSILKGLLLVDGLGAMAVRQEVNMAEELYTEYKEMGEDDFNSLYSSNQQKRTLKYGKNKLVVKGLTTNKKSTGLKKPGLAKYQQAKYIIFHVEEAFEVDEGDKRDIRQSLRSNKDTQILEINTCNPASIAHPYIKYLDDNFKFDEEELRTKGYQWSGIKKILNKTPDGYVETREAFLYVNWRVVEHVISKSVIRDIRSTWAKDPNRAKTIDLGMPGDVEGSIFGGLMKHVARAYNTRHEAVRFGIDYGWGTSGNRSPTVGVCLGISPETTGVMLLDRYDHDNAIEFIDQNVQVDRLLAWMNNVRSRLINDGVISRNETIECRFDNAHIGILAMLQNRVREKRWDWLDIRGCDTKNVLSKISQIEIFKMVLCNGLFLIDDEHDNKTRNEIPAIQWENEKEEKMEHKFSHIFDAIIYAIGAEALGRMKDRDPTYFLYTKERSKW